MYKSFNKTCVLALILCGAATLTSCEKKTDVAVVDLSRLFVQSVPGLAATQHIQEVHKRLQDGMDTVKEEYKNAPEELREQVMADARLRLEQQFVIEQAATKQQVGKAIQETIATWRLKHPEIRLIIASETALGYDPALDITTQILPELKGTKLQFSKLPTVEVSSPEQKKLANPDN